MSRVLVSADLPGPALATLRAAHGVDVGADPWGLGRDGLLARIAGADAVITLVHRSGGRRRISRSPALRIVANCGVVDNVDLAAAALDVHPEEPRVDPALLSSGTAVLTLHIGSADGPTRAAMATLSANAVLDVLANRPPRHPV